MRGRTSATGHHSDMMVQCHTLLLTITSFLWADAALSSKLRLNGRLAADRELSLQHIDGCKADDGVFLCTGLPQLGDGVCPATDLEHILSTVTKQGWSGDKVQVIRTESPKGWLPVPSPDLQHTKVGPPSNKWRILHSHGVYSLDGFLSEQEADAIVAHVSTQDPFASEVVLPVLPTCGFRKSTSWVFFGGQRDSAPFPNDLLDRIEAATQISREHYEASQVVTYRPGDFFSDHYDTSTCDHIGDHKLEELKDVKLRESLRCDDGSRRQATLIVYLTDELDGQGGATYFPKLDVRITPKKGRALFFRPTRADGSTDPLMLHSAETQLSGQKFLLQQWITHGKAW